MPFVMVIIALQSLTAKYGVKLSISYFLGIAIGPLVPFVMVIIALQSLTAKYGVKLSISYFLGIAIG
ncbi:hypothetical protein CTI14_72520, partial [Methylobacterium radiotolerans]